jgi:hypothetical protein
MSKQASHFKALFNYVCLAIPHSNLSHAYVHAPLTAHKIRMDSILNLTDLRILRSVKMNS